MPQDGTERPTLTGEEDGTPVTIEVDVPREVYEREVEKTKRINALPEEERYGSGPQTIVDGLIDMIDTEFKFFVDGEEAFVGIPDPEDIEE